MTEDPKRHRYVLIHGSEPAQGRAGLCSCGERTPEDPDSFWYSGTTEEAERVVADRMKAHGAVLQGTPPRGGTRYLVCSGNGALSTTPDRDVAERRAYNTEGWFAALAVVGDHTVEGSDV